MKSLSNNLLLLIILFATGCNKNETFTDRGYPRVRTLEVTNISKEGARFGAEIVYRGDYEIINYGFLYSQNKEFSFESSQKLIISDNIQEDKFFSNATAALRDSTTYYVQAFLQTSDFDIYGQLVSFDSKGGKKPIITSIDPILVDYYDTLIIKGNHFSYVINDNQIELSEIDATIISSSDTLIKVQIPDLLAPKTETIKITVQNNSVVHNLEEPLQLKSPIINSIQPENALMGDTLLLEGIGFSRENKNNIVTIDGNEAEIISNSRYQLKVVHPKVEISSLVEYSNPSLQTSYDELELMQPTISNYTESQGYYGDQLNIMGNNFGYIPEGIQVYIGGNPCEIIEANNKEIKVEIPLGKYNSRTTYLKVKAGYQSDSISFELLEPWIHIAEAATSTAVIGAPAFSVGNYGYYIIDNNTWKYDQNQNSFLKVADFPDEYTSYNNAVSFVVENNAFVGGGKSYIFPSNNFYKYNITADSWESIQDFPYEPSNHIGFSCDGVGYVLATDNSNQHRLWSYNQISDSWSEIASLNLENLISPDIGFVINDNIYVLTSRNNSANNLLFSYDPTTNNWTQLADVYIDNYSSNETPITINSNAYLCDKAFFLKYDPTSDTWEKYDAPYSSYFKGTGFAINGLGFYFSGKNNTEVWEFNPAYIN